MFLPKVEPLLEVRIVKTNSNRRAKYSNLYRCIAHKYFLVVEVEKDEMWKALLLSAVATATSRWDSLILVQLRFTAKTDTAVKLK